ncbi:RABA2A [Symbiodinium sp. KB8]|nr:RABA2A [Symbiodinium sp. KB8]
MNPLGPNGFLIKAGEHLPLVADGLRCYHKFKGQIEAEERARAFSLQRYLAKDGALVKVAELLPGSNLIASAMLDLRGHHQEAQEALNLLKNWRQCGSPDGPLAKVAEMLPGVDVIAFGIHVQSGNFAQALRSISKTRWTTITGESIVLTMMAETLHEWTLTDLEVVKLDIDPVASFMYGGLLDVVTLLIEVNSQGQQRSRARRVRLNSPRLDGKPHRALRARSELHKDSSDESFPNTASQPRCLEMSMAWLREAAAASAQRSAGNSAGTVPAVSAGSSPSWSRIDDLGGGLFLCGAAALENRAELERLGIRSILNCATEDLYDRSYSQKENSAPLRQKLEGYKVQVFDAQDVEEQPMTDLWKSGSEFIDSSLQTGGGVAIHCAQGISRSSSTCIAYLMMKERMSLDAAFRRVFQARNYIRPNPGFWQQLRDLEKKLGTLPPRPSEADEAGLAMARLDEELSSKKSAMAAGKWHPGQPLPSSFLCMFGEFSKGIYDHTEPPRNPVYWAKDRVVTICRDVVTTLLQDTLPEMVPDMVDSAVAAMNSLLPFYRSSWWPYRVFLPKVVLLGDSRTGKTSLLKQCVEHKFSTDVLPTAGLDFQWKKVLGGREWIKLKLWDCAGEDRFRSLMPAYLQDAAAAIVVYDVTCWRSWSAARDWVSLVHHELGQETLLAVVGNKADLDGRREVPFDEAQKETEALGAIFLETSAKTGDNVDILFQELATQLPNQPRPLRQAAKPQLQDEARQYSHASIPVQGLGPRGTLLLSRKHVVYLATATFEWMDQPQEHFGAAVGKPPSDLEKVLSDRITHISLRHRTVVPVRAVPAREPCRGPGTGKALGAMCCAGGLVHSGWPLLAGCALGCASGLFQLSSWARRQFVPWINARNEQAWLDATKEPKQLYKRSSSQGSCDRASARMPLAVVAELPGEDVEQLASILGDYFCKELPLTKLIGQSGMVWLNERLSRFLASSVDESPAVLPVVLHAEVSEGLYKSLGETWWLPSFSFAVIFQCRLEAGMQVSAAQVVFTDETIDQDAQLVEVTWSRRLNAGTAAPELEVELSIPAATLRIRMIFRQNHTLRLDPAQAAQASNRKLTGSGSHWLRTLEGQPKLQSVQRFLRSSPARRLSSSTKYVEVLAVNDFSRYTSFGGPSNLQALAAHTVAMLNAVTTIYRAAPTAGSFPYPVQVVLVGQHTFLEEDPWQAKFQDNAEADQALLLEEFLTWGSLQMAAGSLPQNDNRAEASEVLLTGRDLLGSTVGLLAPVSSMCDVARSGSINMCGTNDADLPGCAAVVAHEMGHNFGMSHDAGTTACPDSGYIMEAVGDSVAATQFTECSVSDITTFFSQVYSRNSECLENQPLKVFGDPVCGNGFREEGEDCDCGSPCNDPCCDGTTCKFADPSYECSDAAAACCENCLNVTAAAQKVCRPARNTCDLPEVCPGGTSSCPKDEYTYPGASCTLSSNGASYPGLCALGSCKSMRYTCEVDVTRDFEGSWDLSEPCAAFNDDCTTVVCHDASDSSAAACGQRFSVHGSQMAVPDGTPCWHPSEPKGSRGGMCFQGHCSRSESLALVPLCGNGGIDYGEECDCGTTGDDCCDCATCQLKAGSACAGTDPCCDACAFRPAGAECRAALGDCDLPEVCSGSSARCPPDLGKPAGSNCTSNGVPSSCYANVCLPSLDEQCSEKTGGQLPAAERHLSTGSRADASGHLCTALMCCASCSQEAGNWNINGELVTDPWLCSGCVRSTARSTFTVNGASKTIFLGAATDGTYLNSSLCIGAESTTPLLAASCSSLAYYEASVGRCLLCSSACDECNGPTNLDCTNCANGASKDARGACPMLLQVRTDGATVTTTDTSGATDTTGAGGGGGASTTARTGTIAARLRILTFSAHSVWPPRGPHQSEDGASDLANSVSVGILLPIILQLPSSSVLGIEQLNARDRRKVLDVLQTEIRDVDFRGMDPRLAGFAEPINLHFQAMLSWPLTSSPRLDIRNLKVHLSLLKTGFGQSCAAVMEEEDGPRLSDFKGSCDHLYKVVLVGDATVGKTHLLSRYVKGTLPKAPTATIGVEFATRTIPLAVGGTVKAQIWDTAGQERYRAITSSHYRRAVGALLVYDVTRNATFQNCLKWLEELRQNAEDNIIIMLVGNKLDLVEKDPTARQVHYDAALEFARAHKLLFKEASAVTTYNVKHVFEQLLQEVYNQASKNAKERRREPGGIQIQPGGTIPVQEENPCGNQAFVFAPPQEESSTLFAATLLEGLLKRVKPVASRSLTLSEIRHRIPV